MVFEITNYNKSVFIDRNTSHIKHGWQEKPMIMEYNACVSCALIGHNFPTVLQVLLTYSCSFFMKQVRDYRKYNVRLMSADGREGLVVL